MQQLIWDEMKLNEPWPTGYVYCDIRQKKKSGDTVTFREWTPDRGNYQHAVIALRPHIYKRRRTVIAWCSSMREAEAEAAWLKEETDGTTDVQIRRVFWTETDRRCINTKGKYPRQWSGRRKRQRGRPDLPFFSAGPDKAPEEPAVCDCPPNVMCYVCAAEKRPKWEAAAARSTEATLRAFRTAKRELVEDFAELEEAQLCLHAIDALECAFAAVAILDDRGSGAPQHIACLLASDIQRALEAAERMRDLYELR